MNILSGPKGNPKMIKMHDMTLFWSAKTGTRLFCKIGQNYPTVSTQSHPEHYVNHSDGEQKPQTKPLWLSETALVHSGPRGNSFSRDFITVPRSAAV